MIKSGNYKTFYVSTINTIYPDLTVHLRMLCLRNMHNKKYLKKKISDVVTIGTFCYRDQSFINMRGGGGGGRLFFSRKERY